MEIRYCEYNELKPLFFMQKERVDFKYNPSTVYLGAFVDGNIVGLVAWQKIGNVLRYKTDCVLPNYRGKGIYSSLWRKRDELCNGISRSKTTAFCTPMSLGMYQSKGFFRVSERNGITFVEK
jgi:hypothetical protein